MLSTTPSIDQTLLNLFTMPFELREAAHHYFTNREQYLSKGCLPKNIDQSIFLAAAYFLDIPILSLFQDKSHLLQEWRYKRGHIRAELAQEMHDIQGTEWLQRLGIGRQ